MGGGALLFLLCAGLPARADCTHRPASFPAGEDSMLADPFALLTQWEQNPERPSQPSRDPNKPDCFHCGGDHGLPASVHSWTPPGDGLSSGQANPADSRPWQVLRFAPDASYLLEHADIPEPPPRSI